jgi:selenide,water dikinase
MTGAFMTDPLASAPHAPQSTPFRLTALAHGGGCGCKIGPALLREMLSDACFGFQHPDLLVGATTSDDAAVYRINEQQAVIATTDFFMPIVDDPFEFGRISATNALSDVYAMGGSPILALAIVGMPVGKMPSEVMRRIMEGGADVCRAAGIPLAGGHSIDSPEPIYGLAVIGLGEPARIKRNDGARPGDVLVLGKPLGIGVLSSALKKGILDEQGYAQMLDVTTQLNKVGRELAALPGVHAMTDVTGFGLLGHLAEICRGSGVGAEIEFAALPILESARPLLEQGIGPGAIERNWASCSSEVRVDPALPGWAWRLLSDPQTSGGLLVSCAPTAADEVLSAFAAEGFSRASQIGRVRPGAANPRISVD